MNGVKNKKDPVDTFFTAQLYVDNNEEIKTVLECTAVFIRQGVIHFPACVSLYPSSIFIPRKKVKLSKLLLWFMRQ